MTGVQTCALPICNNEPNQNIVDSTNADPASASQSVIKNLFSDYNYVPFYADSNNRSTESWSNSSGDSSLKGVLDQGSSTMREVAFLSGATDMDEMFDWGKEAITTIMDSLNSSSGIVSRVKDCATALLNGGAIQFPEIYQSSDKSTSYNFSFNLRSPYGDVESIFLNVYLPMIHLICLTAPRQIRGNANASTAPFIVKCFSRGWFNCSLGIVESLSISKGDDWNINGFPSSISIDMTVKDLYSDFMISDRVQDYVINPSLQNFILVNSGINVTKPYILQQINLLISLSTSQLFDIPQVVYQGFMEKVRNIAGKWIGF